MQFDALNIWCFDSLLSVWFITYEELKVFFQNKLSYDELKKFFHNKIFQNDASFGFPFIHQTSKDFCAWIPKLFYCSHKLIS